MRGYRFRGVGIAGVLRDDPWEKAPVWADMQVRTEAGGLVGSGSWSPVAHPAPVPTMAFPTCRAGETEAVGRRAGRKYTSRMGRPVSFVMQVGTAAQSGGLISSSVRHLRRDGRCPKGPTRWASNSASPVKYRPHEAHLVFVIGPSGFLDRIERAGRRPGTSGCLARQ